MTAALAVIGLVIALIAPMAVATILGVYPGGRRWIDSPENRRYRHRCLPPGHPDYLERL